jgi:5-methylthioadenosine/S-adenosylhomocysteine deaminase
MKMLSLGLEPSLSTDVECTLCADLFTQMRCALSTQRGIVNALPVAERLQSPPLLTSHDVIRYATQRGAQHLWLGSRIGSLSPGKQADLVLLDTRSVNTTPLNNVAGAVATLMDRSNVETVIVGGKVRKWQGRLQGADLAALADRIEASATGLFERAGIGRDLFG